MLISAEASVWRKMYLCSWAPVPPLPFQTPKFVSLPFCRLKGKSRVVDHLVSSSEGALSCVKCCVYSAAHTNKTFSLALLCEPDARSGT